jgi:hypothetical protein
MKQIMAIMVLLLLTSTAHAEIAPEELWKKTFGGNSSDIAWSIQQTSDSGYIFTGRTNSYGAGKDDFWLVKTDSNGNKKWEKTFGGIEDDEAFSVQQTSDSGYILAGRTNSKGVGGYDAWLVKTDINGNKEWEKTFGGTNFDEASSIQQTSDGGYIFTGRTNSYGAGQMDGWLVKTDSNGNKEWEKTFGGMGDDDFESVMQTSEGGYILAGGYNYGPGFGDFWLVKTDLNGNKAWEKTFGGSSLDGARSVKQTFDAGYIILGFTDSYGAGNRDYWLVKTTSDGEKEWDKTFGGANYDLSYSVQQTSDGGYILAGYTKSYGVAGLENLWLVKTDLNGNEEWNRTFETSGGDVQQTSDGGYILAGYAVSSITRLDASIIKTGVPYKSQSRLTPAQNNDTIKPTPFPYAGIIKENVWIFMLIGTICSIILVVFGPGNKDRVEKIRYIYTITKNKFIRKNLNTVQSDEKCNDSAQLDSQIDIKEQTVNIQNIENVYNDKTEIQDIKTINTDVNLQTFKDVYQFARSDMHKTDYYAEEFASKWISEFADKNFQIFKDAFQFAQNNMHKTDYYAEEFAFHQLKKE